MLIGGPGGPEGLPDPMHGVKDTPVYRTLRGAVNCATTLMAGFTTVRNLGLMVYTAGFLLDVDLMKGGRPGLVSRPAHLPCRTRHHSDRGPSRPHHVPGTGAGDHAAERRAGDRQRRARGAQGRALPDQVRRQADQDLGIRRRDVVLERGRRSAVLGRGAGRDRRRGPPQWAQAWPHTRTATPASGPASGRGWTASSTGRSPPTTPSS